MTLMRTMKPGAHDVGTQRTAALALALTIAMMFAGAARAAPKPTPVSLPSRDAVPAVAVGPAMLRRLSPDQYRQSVADIF